MALLAQDPSQVQVGRVTAYYWSSEPEAALTLAEAANAAGPYPGLSQRWTEPIRLFLVADPSRFDSLTGGQAPDWSIGVAYPASNTIVLKLTGDVRRTLRHEMAHLALHSVVERVPVWFEEGYASRAAGEWSRLEALRVNWALMAGAEPSFHQVIRDIRSGAAHAETAYALATAAVLFLERLGGDRGLEPLLLNLAESQNFDRALRATHHVTLGQFEVLWQRDLRKRYGWVLFFGSLTVFWACLAVLLLSLWGLRRRRDKQRRAALDQGWVISSDEWGGIS